MKKKSKINKKNLPKWMQCLTIKEIRHLREEHITSLYKFKLMRAFQLKMKDSVSFFTEPCFECASMSLKLLNGGFIRKGELDKLKSVSTNRS